MFTEQPLAEKLPANAKHAAPMPWADGRQRLEAGRWYWLATVRPDGRPHVMPVLAVWLEGALFFVAADASRKAHNLVGDPHCVMTVALEDAHLVVEGEAARVKDAAKLQRDPGRPLLFGLTTLISASCFIDSASCLIDSASCLIVNGFRPRGSGLA